MLHIHRPKITVKFVSVLMLIFGLTSQVMAQRELNLPEHDQKPYYFGITLGGNMSRFHTELHPRFLQDDSVYVAEPNNNGGLALGLLATGRLSDRFQVRFNPQLMFINRSLRYKLKFPDSEGETEVTKNVESVTVSFPIQIKFQSDRIGNFRVYMMAGIKGDIDLASNARARKAEDLVKLQKYDFGPELGLGFNFYFPSFILSPELKISNGWRNIHARDENLKYSSVIDRIQSRMIVLSIHIEG